MITYCYIKTGGGHWARVWSTLRFVAERAGAKWPAAQATVNFIGGHDPPG